MDCKLREAAQKLEEAATREVVPTAPACRQRTRRRRGFGEAGFAGPC